VNCNNRVENLACAALIAVPQFNYTCIKKHANSVKEHGSVLLFPETSGEVQAHLDAINKPEYTKKMC
tara:strand:+ start:706 stop:906 length:201 start_codon:yes stop_codon:yes gene_type:complete